MIDDEFIAMIEDLIEQCRTAAASDPEMGELWRDRAKALAVSDQFPAKKMSNAEAPNFLDRAITIRCDENFFCRN